MKEKKRRMAMRLSTMAPKERMPVKRILKGGMRGLIEEELTGLLPEAFFEDPVSSALANGADVIKDSRLRWAGIASLPKGRRIFLKRDKSKGWFEHLKFFLIPSRGRKEWLVASRLCKRSVRIPRPLGWLEKTKQGVVRESYYLSEAIGSGVPFLQTPNGVDREDSTILLARTVKKIHDAGLVHKDFHAGNFLWDGPSLLLTDLHGAKVAGAVPLRQRLYMISHLFHSLRSRWVEEDQRRFFETYFEGESISQTKKEECLRKMGVRMDRLQKAQWRSRTKRCLKESTEFTIQRQGGVVYYRRRNVRLDRIKSIVQEHRRVVAEDRSALLKLSPEVILSRVSDAAHPICVKQFGSRSLVGGIKDYFRRPKAMRAWFAGNGLKARGFACPEPLALVKTGGESLFLMEALEHGEELDRYLARGFVDFRAKRRFIKDFAGWLSRLHEGRIYHRDLKTCNIWVQEQPEGWVYQLLDLEDILLDRKVGEKKLFRNFLQLNASTPGRMTRTDRLRFVRDYLKGRSLAFHEKTWVRRVSEETRKRGVVYVAPWGLVKEHFPVGKR